VLLGEPGACACLETIESTEQDQLGLSQATVNCHLADESAEAYSPQLCFHYACGFCDTLRLAHMLYSLARVTRRDRWCRTYHHASVIDCCTEELVDYHVIPQRPKRLVCCSTHEHSIAIRTRSDSDRRRRIIPGYTRFVAWPNTHASEGRERDENVSL